MNSAEVAREEQPDLVVLDLMLPRLDGFEVWRILRHKTSMPILMLTARAEEVDRVVSLEVGADDYSTKPFSMRELLARVKAHCAGCASSARRWPGNKVHLADLAAQLLADARLLAGSVTPLLQEGANPEALDELARS